MTRAIFIAALICLTLAACAGVNGSADASNHGASISTDVLRFP